jgi:hypothetical protein
MVYPQADFNREVSYEKSTLMSGSNKLEDYDDSFDASHPSSEKSVSLWDLSSQNHATANGSDFEDTGTRTRRRPFKDPQDRAQTAQTRRDNACLRCRMQRIRASISYLVKLRIDSNC